MGWAGCARFSCNHSCFSVRFTLSTPKLTWLSSPHSYMRELHQHRRSQVEARSADQPAHAITNTRATPGPKHLVKALSSS